MFRLAKWYLDCVSDGGDAAVLYWASIRWGALRLRYGAALFRPCRERATDRYTLRPGPAPAVSGDGLLQWECAPLGVRGRWAVPFAGPERTLLEEARGRIEWRCVSLGTDAAIQIAGHTVEGLGYAEQLKMTIKPWHLPFTDLRWGRFVSPEAALVWMRWDGGMGRTWAFGKDLEPVRARILPDTVELPEADLRLAIGDGRIVRAGSLMNTAFRPVRALAWMAPRWRTADETKWLARGTLTGGGVARTGWVVHERVRWA